MPVLVSHFYFTNSLLTIRLQWGGKGAVGQQKIIAHHGGVQNSATGRTHATIKWSLGVYRRGSAGFGRQKECWGTRVEEVG
jgi:hypothetical protein